MYNKILIINKSFYFGDYLKEKILYLNIDVINTKDSIDGLIKMRNNKPDLIIIDYEILLIDKLNFLKEKNQLKSTVNIPIIILYSKKDKLNKDIILELSKYKLYKLLQKPVEIDLLFKVIEEIFNIKLDIDLNSSLINTNLIDDVLIIKILKGLNKDKIELMKYKILEIKEIYKIKISKIILLMTDIGYHNNLDESLNLILKNILSSTNILISQINLITDINYIKEYFSNHPKYRFINITSDINELLESFNRKEFKDYFFYKNKGNENIFIKRRINKDSDITLNLNFSIDKVEKPFINLDNIIKDKKFNIAVVDDDLNVLELMEIILFNKKWNVNIYENGSLFLKDLEKNKPDLIFLDLMMPRMNGFEVMDYLILNNYDIPVIVMSGLVDKRFIFKAKTYGVVHFLTKPIKPNVIIEKAEDVLKSKILNENMENLYKIKGKV